MARFMANRLLKILTNHYILHTFWVCGLGCGVWSNMWCMVGVWCKNGILHHRKTSEKYGKTKQKSLLDEFSISSNRLFSSGGRNWFRTSDLLNVSQALSR